MRARRSRRASAAVVLTRATALAWATATVLWSTASPAQTEDELAAARRTFTRALADEEAKRFVDALNEFRSVAAVKNTINVRYRIASCLESLGRRAEALTEYRATAAMGEGDGAAVDVARAANDKLAELDRSVPRLTITLQTADPIAAEVRIDGALLDASALRAPVPIDVGVHAIVATAPGTVPFHTSLSVPEGARIALVIDLPPAGASSPPPSPPVPAPSAPPAPPSPSSSSSRIPAYVTLAAGGALAAGAIVSAVLRSSSLSTIDAACPQTSSSGARLCPASTIGQVTDARSAARVEGPLAIGLGAGAAIVAGVGVWLLVSAPSSGRAAPSGLGTGHGVQVWPVVWQTGGVVSGMVGLSGPLALP